MKPQCLRPLSIKETLEINEDWLSWHEALGKQCVFVKVIEMAEGRYLHQMTNQIMEVLSHEAVHWLHNSYRSASVEEECDAFAVGLCVDAAVVGAEPAERLIMDGVPLAAFVIRSYPNARRDPQYIPIGQTREWLYRRTGLE